MFAVSEYSSEFFTNLTAIRREGVRGKEWEERDNE